MGDTLHQEHMLPNKFDCNEQVTSLQSQGLLEFSWTPRSSTWIMRSTVSSCPNWSQMLPIEMGNPIEEKFAPIISSSRPTNNPWHHH